MFRFIAIPMKITTDIFYRIWGAGLRVYKEITPNSQSHLEKENKVGGFNFWLQEWAWSIPPIVDFYDYKKVSFNVKDS